ncbi:hypothetical protein PLICRDRAFT_700428 [Plicaturopsis crispa FD-325 SS-3]|nr:hypothetical protein PLICRDRAFT_700428 [Plicaturopsis crispa FD-325 SS-3]
MPAERAGYTVTMFLVDTSPSMGKLRTVELPDGRTREMTNLEWGLQFIKLKIQEMIYNGRKTEQCGVIVFGSEETDNIINEKSGGYEHVSEYIPISQPNGATLAKIDALQPSEEIGDPIDALIVGIETQHVYLASKKTWTRKIIILTDGENPIEIEDWEATVKKMNRLEIGLTVVGIDFDDEELPYQEEDKDPIKQANETFFRMLTEHMDTGIVGTCAFALRETTKPDIKQTKSSLLGTVLRIGDVDARPEEAVEVLVKASKCTATTRGKSWKKFGLRDPDENAMDVDDEKEVYAQLSMRTEYYIDHTKGAGDEDKIKEEEPEEEEEAKEKEGHFEKVEKEQLVRGFKYGSTYAPCPDGQFPRLPTKKGIDICGFFKRKNFRRELALGEVQYIWADPASPQQQVALSSIAQAMHEEKVMAIARWVSRDGMDPKMGVLAPSLFDKVDCLVWVQMPFADDVRKYTFASLDNVISKKGEVITKHPYIPTESQMEAMDAFVDAMDLMEAGDKDDDGYRQPWFDPRYSYNPAVHRTKQALFHSAVVSDLGTHPLPPPHPKLLKYFNPPKRVLKRARDAIETCKKEFNVKEGMLPFASFFPKKVARLRKDGHVRARDDDEDVDLLSAKRPRGSQAQIQLRAESSGQVPADKKDGDDSATEDEDEDLLAAPKKDTPHQNKLPTPARSVSPPMDQGRAPGKIIGTSYPLKDFQQNIAEGDLVTKAVEDLAWVILEIISKPFGGRRSSELIDCMRELRTVALKEDEIDAWNDFLKKLKETCLSERGDKRFWAQIQHLGRGMSLLSESDAAQYGTTSSVSDADADSFLDS